MMESSETADRDWFVAAAFRLKMASAQLWRRVQRFYAELLRSEGLSTPDEEARDREYFRLKMAEARRRRRQERMRRIAEILAQRSGVLLLDRPVDLDAVPGLTNALDGLVNVPFPPELLRRFAARSDFDLDRYQQHILSCLGRIAIEFEAIPALDTDLRKDRIYRFVALIFLAQARQVDIEQSNDHILVRRRESYEQGQGIPGPAEEAA